MKIGYARVSTKEQSFDLQIDALQKSACEQIYQEVASGSQSERQVLERLLNNIRYGQKTADAMDKEGSASTTSSENTGSQR